MPKRTLSHHPWLTGELKDPVTASNYLNEAYSDSPEMFLVALRNVGEAWRMSLVASKAGVGRESLYKTLSERGNPRLHTLDAVLRAVGIKIEFQPEKAISVRPSPARTHVTLRRAHNPIERREGGFLTISHGNVQDIGLANCTSGMATLTVTTSLLTANNAAVVAGFGSERSANQSGIRPIPSFGSGPTHFQTATVSCQVNRNMLLAVHEDQRQETEPPFIPTCGCQLAAPPTLCMT